MAFEDLTSNPAIQATLEEHPDLIDWWDSAVAEDPGHINVGFDDWFTKALVALGSANPQDPKVLTYRQARQDPTSVGAAADAAEAEQQTPMRWAEGIGWFHDNEDGWIWKQDTNQWLYDYGDGNLWNAATEGHEQAPGGQSPREIGTVPKASEPLGIDRYLGEIAVDRAKDWEARDPEYFRRASEIRDQYQPAVDAARDTVTSMFGGQETGWFQDPELGYLYPVGDEGWYWSEDRQGHVFHAGGNWMQDEQGNYIELQNEFDPQPFSTPSMLDEERRDLDEFGRGVEQGIGGQLDTYRGGLDQFGQTLRGGLDEQLTTRGQGIGDWEGEQSQAIAAQLQNLMVARDRYGEEMRPAIDAQIAALTEAQNTLRDRRMGNLEDVLHGGPQIPEGWVYHPDMGYLKDEGKGWYQTHEGEWFREDAESGMIWNQQTGQWQDAPRSGSISSAATGNRLNEGLYGTLEGPAAARLSQAEAEAAALNIGAQEERDRVEAEMARQGFVGGSSASDANMARALIQGRQGAAQTRTQAELDNALALSGLQEWAAMQRYGVGGEYAEGMHGIDTFAAGEDRALANALASMGLDIRTLTAQERRNLSDAVAGMNLDLTNFGADETRRIGDYIGDQEYGIRRFGADERRSLSDTLAAGNLSLAANDRERRLSNISLPFQMADAETAFAFGAEPYRDFGLRNAVDLVNLFPGGNAAPPSVSPGQVSPVFEYKPPYGEAGPGLVKLGSSWIDRGLSAIDPNTGKKTGGSSWTPVGHDASAFSGSLDLSTNPYTNSFTWTHNKPVNKAANETVNTTP